MGRMAELHYETAPQRADDAEKDCQYLRMVVDTRTKAIDQAKANVKDVIQRVRAGGVVPSADPRERGRLLELLVSVVADLDAGLIP